MRRFAARGLARAALTVVLAVAFCVPGVSAAQDTPLVATGVVTDAVSGLPIEGAVVFAVWQPEENGWGILELWTKTDANGVYEVPAHQPGLEAYPGRYEMRAAATAYVEVAHEAMWDGSAALNVDFALDPAEVMATGVATDLITGDPVGDIAVKALSTDGCDELTTCPEVVAQVRTANDGTYVLYDERGVGAEAFRFEAWSSGQLGATVYMIAGHDATWDGATPLEIDFAMRPFEDAYIAIAGSDRYETAIEVSKRAYPDGLAEEGAKTVVIATGMDWPDALGGTALAGALDGPLLLTQKNTLPAGLIAEIRRLAADNVVILGGTRAVDTAVETALAGELGEDNVERIGGRDRYETANKVATRVIGILGDGYDGTAFVATGTNFPDALAASPLAARQGWPYFLAGPMGLSAGTEAAMAGVTDVLVLGGTDAVSAQTETVLEARLGDEGVRRLWGPNRFATAVAVAEYGVAEAGHTWDLVGVATGGIYPDALVGGVLQGKIGSVMLLAERDRLEHYSVAALEANAAHVDRVTFFGGPNTFMWSARIGVLLALGHRW